MRTAKCYLPCGSLSVILMAWLAAGPAFSASIDHGRAALAASDSRVVLPSTVGLRASALADPAWIRPFDSLAAIEYDGHPDALALVERYGAIEGVGGRMLALGTGRVSGNAARPGADFQTREGQSLETTLTLRFEPPPGARHLTMRYRFLTAEYPEFSAAGFEDVFSVDVVDAAGRRTVARESSLSKHLYPVAASLTGGSPMDLYSSDSGALTGSFRTGLPAAGLTDWQRISAPIEAAGPVEVIFSIRDGSDGLVDSTVLIEQLDLKAVRLEAPARISGTGNRGGDVPSALECIFQGGIVQGAVADGVTPINVIFFNLSGPGTATYSFAGGQAPQDGGFDQVGGDQRLESVTVQSVLGSNGWESVAQYLVPEEFNRGGDEGLGNRIVNLRIDFIPDDPDEPPVGATLPFNLLRPALILMHGLWSSATTWDGSPLLNDARLRIHPGDYRPTHAARFSTNTTQPAKPIREACQSLRADGIAATQFDYVGHSMGGIVGRNFDNLVPDLINKFISLNTPHTGSPLGNLVVSVRDNVIANLFFEQKILDWLRENEKAIDEGALDDLSVGSAAINSIAATTVPSHALVGIGGSDLVGDALAQAPGQVGVLFKILNFLDDTTDLFAGIQHDFIVGRSSQEGGIASSAFSVFDGLESIHTSAPSSPAYAARIVELLNSDATGASFGSFPPPSTVASLPAAVPSSVTVPRIAGTGDIGLILPDGAQAAPGDMLPVEVTAGSDFGLQRALVVSRFDAVLLEGPDFAGALKVPEDFLGEIELLAFGVDASDTFTVIDTPVVVSVTIDIELTGLSILNTDMLLVEADDLRQVYVTGTFADGQTRSVTDPGTGTVYASADPDIAEVTPNGVVIGLVAGVTTISAANSGLQDSISVEVVNGQVLLRDGFE